MYAVKLKGTFSTDEALPMENLSIVCVRTKFYNTQKVQSKK